jgi:AraC-like DNA-binding protein
VSCFSLLRFDSEALPEAERFAAFTAGMVNFDSAPLGAAPFEAQARAWKVGAVVLAQARSSDLAHDRPLARVLADDVDHLYVNLHLTGRVTADCGDRPVTLGAGSLIVIDMRQPCRMALYGCERISVGVPRRLLAPRLEGLDPHGLSVSGGLVPMLGAMLGAVCAGLDDLEPGHGAAVERMVVDQVCETLLDSLRGGAAGEPQAGLLAGRARAFIDAHLAEPLDAAAICAALGVSRSRLYRAFDGKGGVLRALHLRRLRRARALLEGAGERRSLAALAEATGFSDKSHLARAFKREFGLTPSQARALALGRTPVSAGEGEAAALFASWISALD